MGTGAALALTAAIAAGAALRLVWVEDMEWKVDEVWTFEEVRRTLETGVLPWLGMPMGIGIPNPGASLWVFAALGALAGTAEPTALARAVQLTNVLAIALVVVFALRSVGREEREPWLWAAALVAVNPIAVLLHRKIWPASIMPLPALAMLVAWWHRDRRSGAFLWGFVGALLGQIEGAGFFFAGGFTLWTALVDRTSTRWRSWLAGSVIGALAMVPWLLHFPRSIAEGDLLESAFRWTRPFEAKFWRLWLTEPLGLALEYSLGPHFGDFLGYPLVGGGRTYGVLLLHVAIALVAGAIVVRAVRSLRAGRSQAATGSTRAVNAALWGFGGLITAACVSLHRYHLVAAFPLPELSAAWLALFGSDGDAGRTRNARALLAALVVLELLLTISVLGYIHVNGGAPRGDYGVSYHAQGNDAAR